MDTLNVLSHGGGKKSWKLLTPKERFYSRVYVQENGCWLWVGAVTQRGYGNIQVNNMQMGAHRFGYEIYKGKIPCGKVIDHLCRNTLCVNPEHLEAVDNRENTLRGVSPSVRSYISRIDTGNCKNGHLVSENWDHKVRRCYACHKLDSRIYREELKNGTRKKVSRKA